MKSRSSNHGPGLTALDAAKISGWGDNDTSPEKANKWMLQYWNPYYTKKVKKNNSTGGARTTDLGVQKKGNNQQVCHTHVFWNIVCKHLVRIMRFSSGSLMPRSLAAILPATSAGRRGVKRSFSSTIVPPTAPRPKNGIETAHDGASTRPNFLKSTRCNSTTTNTYTRYSCIIYYLYVPYDGIRRHQLHHHYSSTGGTSSLTSTNIIPICR